MWKCCQCCVGRRRQPNGGDDEQVLGDPYLICQIRRFSNFKIFFFFFQIKRKLDNEKVGKSEELHDGQGSDRSLIVVDELGG